MKGPQHVDGESVHVCGEGEHAHHAVAGIECW